MTGTGVDFRDHQVGQLTAHKRVSQALSESKVHKGRKLGFIDAAQVSANLFLSLLQVTMRNPS